MEKKQIERKILALVYDESKYLDILASEEPDFKIKLYDDSDYFGVEITTFHYSESYARLRNIPDYFDEVVGNGKYRHKHDKKELEVHDVVIQDAEGNEKSRTKCLIRPRPTIGDHVAMISEVIRDKEDKLPKYQKNLTHINLIIFDAEAGFCMFEKDEYYNRLFVEDLRQRLYRTGFREIFLVTLLHDRWVYVPLKMNLLVGEWYLFHTLIKVYFPERVKKYKDEFQMFFAQYMQYKTGKAFYRRHQRYMVEVIWANAGVMLNEPSNSILDHADFQLPSDVISPNLKGVTRFFNSKAFQAALVELFRKHTFSTEMAFDAKKPVDFLQGKMKSVIASEIPKNEV